MIDLNEMKEESLDIAIRRGQEVDGISCLKHCAGEVAEAIDAYKDFEQVHGKFSGPSSEAYNLRMELADIIMCVLTLCAREHLDIEEALRHCIKKNKARIPEKNKRADYVDWKLHKQSLEIKQLEEKMDMLTERFKLPTGAPTRVVK